MLIKTAADIPTSEITDERLYLNRRRFLQSAAVAAAGAAAFGLVPGSPGVGEAFAQAQTLTPLPDVRKSTGCAVWKAGRW